MSDSADRHDAHDTMRNEQENTSSTSGELIWLRLSILIVFLVLYVGMLGPCVWLIEHGYATADVIGVIQFLYVPLDNLCHYSSWVQALLKAYVDLFR
jgi:hypothetical protein